MQFYSDGLRLGATLQLPSDRDGAVPVVVFCSGYQGFKDLVPAVFWGPLTDAGIACFSFDYRGYGTSEGDSGRVFPLEYAHDTSSAVTFLSQQPEFAGQPIGVMGWGLGGGVAVQAAADDPRIAAAVMLNGVGDAGRAVRDSRPYWDWLAMQERIEADRARAVVTGKSELVSPWDVVPLDGPTRDLLDNGLPRDQPFAETYLEAAAAYYAFRPEDVVARLSGRTALLVVHGACNRLHPIDEARSVYAAAGEPKTLIEITTGDHLNWIQPEGELYAEVMPRIAAWLEQAMPARTTTPLVESSAR
jgi:pimeloyl-ACP methyl ester carboxylesterase